MKRLQIFGLIIFYCATSFAQINMTDSSAQVIGYWDKNEKQSYIVSQQKYKIKNSDTSSREFHKYSVDITIVDSTADSYIIDWFYKDFEIQTDNPLLTKLASITEDMNVRIRTNELGVFQEVVNWKDVRDYILKGTKMLKKETKDIPIMDDVIKQIEDMFCTKESIESGAIKEIQQFYTFHGAKYEYGDEYNAASKVANLFGGEPFDTKLTVWLDELNPDDNNCIIRMKQTVDSEQLTKATLEYVTKMSETLKIPAPKKDDIQEITNDTWTASRIHGSGWIIYSVETKETFAEGHKNIEERIIEIK